MIEVQYGDAPEPLRFNPAANVEAEAALIGAMLVENRHVDMVADILSAPDFMEALHGRLFDAIVGFVAAGKRVTPVTLKPMFENDEAIKNLGGIGYLAQLTGDSSSWLIDPRDTAEHIRDLATLRRMQIGLFRAASDCSHIGEVLLPDVIKGVVEQADSVLETDTDGGVCEISGADAMGDLMRSFDEPMHGVECRQIPEMDRVLGPIRPKQLVLLAARPSMGKTAVAISYAIGAAKAGFGVLFVSLEMASRELAARIAADMCFNHGETAVPYAAIDQRRLNEGDKRRVAEAASRMHSLPLHIIDAGNLSTAKLNVMVKRYIRRFAARGQKLDLVIVDYLQLMRPGIKTNSRVEAIGEVSQSLKAIAKDHDVGVMALAQLSREVEKRPDKKPILADLRDSGQLEQDADSVMFLLRPEYYLEQDRPDEMSPKFHEWKSDMEEVENRLEFIVAKRRNGRTGTGVGSFYGAYQAVR